MLLITFLVIGLLETTAQMHTQFFEKNWALVGNNNSYFFDSATFGVNYPIDPCTPNSENNNHKFKNYVDSMTECTGQWCINDEFKCVRGDSRKCYNTEHIIDLNGPELQEYNKNIFANLVMACGIWNQQMGRLQVRSYSALINEKETVYSFEVVNLVRQMIIRCHGSQASTNFSSIMIAGIVISSLGLFLLVIVCTRCTRPCCTKFCRECRDKCRGSYDQINSVEVGHGIQNETKTSSVV